MLSRCKWVLSLVALFTVPAGAGTLAYVITGAQQFGTIDLSTGKFTQIGPNTPEGEGGLVQGPNGSLLTLTFAGNLDAINPTTGVTTLIGATGLADCTAPGISPCGPTSASFMGTFQGKYYATDFGNSLYSVNPATGVATLIGPTGIPALPFLPLVPNPDGSFGFYDESLFGFGGNFYAYFDAVNFNPATLTATPIVPAGLYRVNPATGAATFLTATDIGLSAIADIGGTLYAFSGATGNLSTLDVTTGVTTFVSSVDPDAGLVVGATSTPEPASIVFAGLGLAAVALYRRRTDHHR